MVTYGSTLFERTVVKLDNGNYEAICKYTQTSVEEGGEPDIREFKSSAVAITAEKALSDAMVTAVSYLQRINFQLSGK